MTTAAGETRIQLCGRLKADVEGRHVTPALRGKQGRVLLAYLVINRGRPVSRDELIMALWPEHPPADPSAALRTQLSRLRSALGTHALAGRDAVELHLPEATWVDVEAAEAAIQAAEGLLGSSGWKDAWAHGNVALNISSRPFLAGFDAPWVEEVRSELAELQTRAREAIARAGIGLGGSELAGAERSARELVRTAPFRETGYVLLMRALVASGNTAEALRAYEQLRSVLREELGTAPGAEIQALHRRLLTGREGDGEGVGQEPSPIASSVAAPLPIPAAELPLPTWLVPARRSPFVGRAGEIGRLEDLWDEAAVGLRQIVLVAGDPGMGKTRLATEFAQGVHDTSGALVLYGRADEHGTQSYQPFVEALRHWAINTPAEDLESTLGRHAGVLARLVPEITIRLPDSGVKEGELARDVLFDGVTATLSAIAATRPTLLVIDDLHWADQGSMLMFRHLARAPDSSRLLVLATHRDTVPSDSLNETLADLGRERLFERIRLGGLGRDETATLVASIQGTTSSPAMAQSIHTETGGNPFLVEALVHHVSEHQETLAELGGTGAAPRDALYLGGVPRLVREAVAHRSGELGRDVEGVLEVASVVGREFESELVTEVSDLEADSVVAALETAVTAGLLIDVPGTLDRYAFSHSLFRQTIYSGLPKGRRAALHKRLAESLERRHGADPHHVAELARHYSGAGGSAAPKALEYCVRAGAAALGAFSYDEAVEHYGQALVAIDTAASDDQSLRCEVLLALGEAEWRGGHVEDARETFVRAARIARTIDDAGALGRAALGFCGVGWERFGAPDPDAGQLLEGALDAQPADQALRAKLTARLAEVIHSGNQTERAEQLGEQAIEIARSTADPTALAAALIGRWYAILRPDTLAERDELVVELLAICEQLRDRDLSLQAQTLGARVAAEKGDMRALGTAIAEHAKLADQSKQPANQLHSRAYRAAQSLAQGQFDEVERLASEVIELGVLAQSPGAVYYSAVELIMLRWEQGRLAELQEPLQELFDRTGAPIWRAGLALLSSERDDEAGAREGLDELTRDGCAAIPFNGNWLGAMTFLVFTCLNLRDRERATELSELLAPYRESFVVVGAVAACLGPVSHLLGGLALTRGDFEAAIGFEEEAANASRGGDSQLWLARADFRLAQALRGRGAAGDSERAEQLLVEARVIAERLGMGRMLRLIDAAEDRSATASPRP